MTKFGSRINAAILGGVLSLSNMEVATAAPCSAGDLAGTWRMYATVQDQNLPASVMWCDIALSNASSFPIKYSLSGTCRIFTTDKKPQINRQLSGDASIIEAANCKMIGAFGVFDGSTFIDTATLLASSIEGGTPKNRVTGVARIEVTPHTAYQLWSFTWQR